jgi:hypothetical protein
MYLNIENTFMFNFFPDIRNEEISIESAHNIIQFLIKYKSYYNEKCLTFYNTKTFICSINYQDNKWIILDNKYNLFEINFNNETINSFSILEYIDFSNSQSFVELNIKGVKDELYEHILKANIKIN